MVCEKSSSKIADSQPDDVRGVNLLRSGAMRNETDVIPEQGSIQRGAVAHQRLRYRKPTEVLVGFSEHGVHGSDDRLGIEFCPYSNPNTDGAAIELFWKSSAP